MRQLIHCINFSLLLLIAYAGSALAEGLDYPLTRITDKIHVIYGPRELPNEKNQGFRNNVVIVQTSKGVVLFDPGGSASAGQMVIKKVHSLTDKPVVAVFVSHAHGDHWLGNEAIKDRYPHAVIYGHPVCNSRISGADGKTWLDSINKVTKGKANGTRVVAPDRVVNNGDYITFGDTQFKILHAGKAHTDNDIMIEIVGTGVLFSGDVIRNGLLGIMEEDASFGGNIKAIDSLIVSNYKTIIPGHGTAGGNDMVRNYQNYLKIVYSNVKQMYAKGLADFEMKPKILPKVSGYKDWSGFDMRLGRHISRAYLEVEKEAF